MLSIMYTFVSVLSFIFGYFGDKLSAVSEAALSGAGQGITFCISIAGAICLWSGIFRAMEALGISQKLNRLFSPLLNKIYPQSFQDSACAAAITGNFVANLLGLGNAATPMGMEAVHRMAASTKSARASDEMCRLVVMNTASVQLLPSTVAAVRTSLGCAHALDILPAVWLCSLCSVTCGLAAAYLFSKRWK